MSNALYGDERVTEGFGCPPLTGQELEDKFQQLIGPWAQDGFSQFIIIENKTQEEAYTLHSSWKGSVLRVAEDASHAASEPGIRREMQEAAKDMLQLLTGQNPSNRKEF